MNEVIRKFHDGPLTIVVGWCYDEAPDLSYLGKYYDKMPRGEEFVVDRYDGVLLQAAEEPMYDQFVPLGHKVLRFSQEQFDAAEDAYAEAYDEWNDHPWKTVATGLRKGSNRECRWFVPENIHAPKEWGKIKPVDVADYYHKDRDKMRRFGIDAPAIPEVPKDCYAALAKLYMCQDYQRMEDYQRGDWYMRGYVVEILANSREVAHASLWGVESSANDAYVKEILDGLMKEAKDQLPGAIMSLSSSIMAIAEFLHRKDVMINA